MLIEQLSEPSVYLKTLVVTDDSEGPYGLNFYRYCFIPVSNTRRISPINVDSILLVNPETRSYNWQGMVI